MKLSYVIPCYNMEKYLPECIDSLLNQNMDSADYEVIVVNDESKDSTLEIARKYAEKFPNVKIIDKKNAGVGAARNSGLDIASGKYIYFLDPDDYLARNVIPRLLEIMEMNNLDILTFRSHMFKKSAPKESANIDQVPHTIEVLDGISYIAQYKYKNEIWWFITNREFMVNSGIRFVEGRWMEDAILCTEIILASKRIALTELDVHRYRVLPTSAMRNKTPEHYKKVIYDNANAAHVFENIIEGIPEDHPKAKECVHRLKTRQQSFVFFLMVRLMKSDISVKKIPEMLDGFEKKGAYPLNNFLGKDYHGFNYAFLVFIFNTKPLINPFIKVFRTFYTFVG
ncbi:MAG: glycosyltransferase [Bacteroidota bacterium]